eukprot:COSAG01_NODE_367_length_18064_cov_23.990315_16_plen_93_part_00
MEITPWHGQPLAGVFTGLANFDWGACVCSLYRQYAVEQNLSEDELANLISLMLYAGALSCMMTFMSNDCGNGRPTGYLSSQSKTPHWLERGL